MLVPALIHVAVVYGTVMGLITLGFSLTHEATGYMNLGFTVNLGVSMGAGFLISQLMGVDPMATLLLDELGRVASRLVPLAQQVQG